MSVYAQDYGYFFNSNSNDRTYNADSFETWLKPFFVSGVFTGCLQVQAQSTPDMTVKVTKGYANLDGKAAYWPSDNTLTIETASGVYDRIDTIVLRRDNTNRRVSLEVVKGTASASPSPTAPTRNSDTYELVLAEVLVGTGVTEIAGSAITDKRPDTDVCGYVVAAVQTPDFSELYAQFSAQAEEFMGDQAAEFLAWFEEMKDQLSEDAAGHLQLEIDGKTDKVTGSLINGKLAGLDSNGNLTNSGYKPADFLDVGSVSYSDYGTSSTTPSIGIPQGRVFTHNGFVYKAKRNIAGNVSFSSLGASDITQMRLAYDLDALNSNCTPTAFTGFEPATGFVEEHNYSFMLNGVLHVQYGAKKSSGKITANTWTKIAEITDSSITLPTGNFVIPCVSIGATAAARGMINANGELQVHISGSDCTGGTLTGMLY